MTEENKEIETDKEKKQSKSRISTSCLCIILLFISIFCCACTNKGENGGQDNAGLKSSLQFKKIFDAVNNLKIDKGKWIVIDDEMSKTRYPASANLLPDGNVLIMGGTNSSIDTADIFDPKQLKIIKSIQLNDEIIEGYGAVSLKNGDVYIYGGYNNYGQAANTAKIFDAKTYDFRKVKDMEYILAFIHSSVLLENGNVLILHGFHTDGQIKRNYQVYNPQKDEYYYTKNIPYSTLRGEYRNMILDSGKILLFKGGSYIYDYKTNAFEKTEPQMPMEYFFIPLDKNSYLNLLPSDDYTSGYVYYIKEDKKIPVKNNIPRTVRPGNQPIFVTLKNGNVLIMGINVVEMRQETNAVKKYSSFLYDREKNMFFQIPNPPYPMSRPGIVMLQNGDILFAGGRSDRNGNKIQIYRY